MTITLQGDTLPVLTHRVGITAYHETFGDLDTPVYVSIPGVPHFTIPSNDAKRFGRWLTTGFAEVPIPVDAAALEADIDDYDPDNDEVSVAGLAEHLLAKGWTRA